MNNYNENDPYCAQWLRNLMQAGLIPPGVVDERSIKDVAAEDVAGYAQCHFFAGIGGWTLALELAGWPADRSVWTGSCPCQPFSAAGARAGSSDERHLWPEFYRLIAACRPGVIFGEQVASADVIGLAGGKASRTSGMVWFDGIRADLAGACYAVGGADLPAAGVGAPHIRQRLWWVASRMADNGGERRQQIGRGASGDEVENGRAGRDWGAADGDYVFASDGEECGVGLADTLGAGFQVERGVGGVSSAENGRDSGQDAERSGGVDNAAGARRPEAREHDGGSSPLPARPAEPCGVDCAVGDAAGEGLSLGASGAVLAGIPCSEPERPSDHGPWSDREWLWCMDGRARAVESGTFPLAHGISNRMGRLRAYGNAISPQVAAEFIRAYQDVSG